MTSQVRARPKSCGIVLLLFLQSIIQFLLLNGCKSGVSAAHGGSVQPTPSALVQGARR